MDNFPYLFAAYTIIWAALFSYVFIINNRQRQLRKELDSLRQVLKESEKGE
ncbi:MAG: CcmD family protein [Chloroflexi bacterium]|nr:CcmD family protein [Chloroflexota bacterium]